MAGSFLLRAAARTKAKLAAQLEHVWVKGQQQQNHVANHPTKPFWVG
jgi:hypothetical protein